MRPLSHTERHLYLAVTGRHAPRCLVQRWPWWWRGFRGVALGALILVKDDDPALVCHEATHVAQFYADPLRFWFRYGIELRRIGYALNRYELEAVAVAAAVRRRLSANGRSTAGGTSAS